MDSITQIALGAVIGQAVAGRKIGAKAMVFGALAGFLPDLDVLITPVARYFGNHDEFLGWKYHRHFSHSIWFGPVLGSLMGWGLWKWYGKQAGHLLPWIMAMVLALLTHPLLDTCTIYGTQLLAPFNNHRFFISSVSIIDPVYTLPLLLSLFLFRIKRTRDFSVRRFAPFVLLVTTLYLAFGWHLNFKAEDIAKAQLAERHIGYDRLNAYTTIFQPWLRRIVVWQADGTIRVGFVSTYAPSRIYWTCVQQVDPDTRQKVSDQYPGQMVRWFSVDTMAVVPVDDTQGIIRASDARYGLPGPSILGWWGVEFAKQDNGELKYLGRARAERDASWAAIGQLFRASYGLPNHFLPAEDRGCSN